MRFDGLVKNMLEKFDDAFVFGGYVRGQVDPKKQISDIDLAVRPMDYDKARSYLCSVGCKEVRVHRMFDPFESFATNKYSRFMCPQSIGVDLIDHESFFDYRVLIDQPSDVHHLVLKKEGLVSCDENRFTTSDILYAMKSKIYRPLKSGAGCEKLEREGFRPRQ